MDLRYMLTLEDSLNKNRIVSKYLSIKSFVTVYKNKIHLSENIRGIRDRLVRFDDKFDVIIVVGDGKGNTMFYGEDELLEAWEQYKSFIKLETDERNNIDNDVFEYEYSGAWVESELKEKHKRIDGWDEF